MDEPTRMALGHLIERMQPQATEYCFLFIQWWPVCLTKSEWAAWVQAVGSVAAIGIAIVLGRATDRDQRRHARNNTIAFAATTTGAIDLLVKVAEKGTLPDIGLARASLETCVQLGSAIRLELLPLDAISAVVTIRSLAAQAAEACRRYEIDLNPNSKAVLDSVVRRCQEKAADHIEALKNFGSRKEFKGGLRK